jgi:hypothetical protein
VSAEVRQLESPGHPGALSRGVARAAQASTKSAELLTQRRWKDDD